MIDDRASQRRDRVLGGDDVDAEPGLARGRRRDRTDAGDSCVAERARPFAASTSSTSSRKWVTVLELVNVRQSSARASSRAARRVSRDDPGLIDR
jgi:hypothetical protein